MSEWQTLKPVIFGWWKSLQGLNEDKGVNRRGERAGLRRCRTPGEAAYQEGYHQLREKIAEKLDGKWNEMNQWTDHHHYRLQMLAALLSHVLGNNPSEEPGVSLAGGSKGDGGLSKLRFRRLISHREVDQGFFDSMVRALKLVKGVVNVYEFMDAVWFWTEKRRRDWAHQYYGAKAAKAN